MHLFFFQASFYMPQNPTDFPFNHVQKFHQNLSPRKVRIFEEPDADVGVPPDGVLPDGVPAVDGSTAVDDGASSSAPPPPPPPGPMPPNHPPPQGDAVMPPPPGPMPPNHPPPQGDAAMPLGQDFFIV